MQKSPPEADHPVRIALLQDASAPADVEANLRTLRSAARRAREGGAKLLVTPEMFVTGYNLGTRVSALASQPLVQRVADVAKSEGIAVTAGLPRTRPDGVTNSAVFVSRAGEILAEYDKTHLFGALDRSMFIPGDRLSPLTEWHGLRVGLLICYDAEFPETVRTLADRGADLLLVPTAQMEPFAFVAESVIPSRAWESQLYIAYANHVGDDGDLRYVGRSVIAAPDPSRNRAARADDAQLLFADIDPAVLRRSRRENPYLHDRRLELYTP